MMGARMAWANLPTGPRSVEIDFDQPPGYTVGDGAQTRSVVVRGGGELCRTGRVRRQAIRKRSWQDGGAGFPAVGCDRDRHDPEVDQHRLFRSLQARGRESSQGVGRDAYL